MEQNDVIYKRISKIVEQDQQLVEKVVRSMFELLHDTMENATVDNAPPVHFQYLGTWQSNPYHLEKIKARRVKKDIPD